MAKFLKLNELLTDDDYTVTDEEVKQAFLNHGFAPQHDTQNGGNQMTIATLKDFEIENIEEDYYTGTEFQGTWADNTCELCDVTITMYHDDKRYELSIKPADPGDYGSYGGDRSRGKGISTEILIDIIQQLTDEPDELTFENFVNNYFHEYGYSHDVKLKNSKNKYYLGKPINLITEPKPIKRLMPVYTFDELTPELVKTLVSKEFFESRAYTFNEMFKDLASENEHNRNFGLISLLRLVAQDKHGRRNHDAFALLLPDFDIKDIFDGLDQYKPFVSVENKNLVYSLNKL